MKILKPKEVARMLNVTVKTLQNWDKENKLVAFRSQVSNRRYYTEEQVNQFLGKKNRLDNKVVIYTRVSTHSQKPDMENQIEFLRQYANAKGYIISEIITDIGSGLNYSRKKWNQLLQDVMDKKISKIIVSHKDRFIRFGYDWFESLCKKFGCEIEVVNNEKTSPEQEVVDDLISIIHCFSCRVYGLRKYKTEITKERKAL